MLCLNLRHRRHFWARMLVWVPVVAVPVWYYKVTGTFFYLLPIFHVGWMSYSFSLLVTVQIRDGLPVSDDSGLGIKSIQYVTRKYNGTIAAKYLPEEKRFTLTILFPNR